MFFIVSGDVNLLKAQSCLQRRCEVEHLKPHLPGKTCVKNQQFTGFIPERVQPKSVSSAMTVEPQSAIFHPAHARFPGLLFSFSFLLL